MKCQEARYILDQDYIEGAHNTHPDELQVHLIACAKCRNHRDELENIHKAFQEDPEVKLPLAIADLAQQEVLTATNAGRKKFILSFLAGGIVFLVLGSLALTYFTKNRKESPPVHQGQGETAVPPGKDEETPLAEAPNNHATVEAVSLRPPDQNTVDQVADSFAKISQKLDQPVKGELSPEEIDDPGAKNFKKKNLVDKNAASETDQVRQPGASINTDDPVQKKKEAQIDDHQKIIIPEKQPAQLNKKEAALKPVQDRGEDLKTGEAPDAQDHGPLQEGFDWDKMFGVQNGGPLNTGTADTELTLQSEDNFKNSDIEQNKKEAFARLKDLVKKEFAISDEQPDDARGDNQDDSQDHANEPESEHHKPDSRADDQSPDRQGRTEGPASTQNDIMERLMTNLAKGDFEFGCDHKKINEPFKASFDAVDVTLAGENNRGAGGGDADAADDSEAVLPGAMGFLADSKVRIAPEDLKYYLGYQQQDRIIYTTGNGIKPDMEEMLPMVLRNAGPASDEEQDGHAEFLKNKKRAAEIVSELEEEDSADTARTVAGQGQQKSADTPFGFDEGLDQDEGFYLNYCEEIQKKH
ncbi:MAG: hypothetical protein HQM16_12340 [Deltaproteobacteria bacterium]|nr:hypothetical protein [Deltaproteobacteria bacterium]